MKTHILSFFAAAGLAACTASPIVGIYPQVISPEVRPGYYPQEIAIFGAAGGKTEVYGSPADGASAADVVRELHLPYFSAAQKLTAIEPAYPTDEMRLLLIFAPQSAGQAEAACRGEARGGVAGAQMKVQGVFCRGRRVISDAVVFAKASPGAGDPALASALNLLIANIMPAVDPNQDNDEGQPRIP